MTDELDTAFAKVKVKSEDINCVLYHGSKCPDGYWSRLSAQYALQDKEVKYIAVYDRKKPPFNLTGYVVAICDFCYDKETTLRIIEETKGNVVILDHHQSAQNDLIDISFEYKVFNMNFSGAYISWKYFNRTKDVPKVIKLVQDRDLWKLDRSEEADHLFAYHNFTECENPELHLKLLDEKELDKAIEQGSNIKAYINKTVDSIKKYSITRMCKIKNTLYVVEYISSHHFQSDVGNILLKEINPHADFSAVYGYNDPHHKTNFSLRSTNEKADVGKIAVGLGGGGHRNASGCSFAGLHNMLPVVHYEMSFIHDILDSTYDKKINNLKFTVLNTDQYPWNFAEWLSKKHTNVITWHIAKRGCVLYIWTKKCEDFHKTMDYEHEPDEVDFKIGTNSYPQKTLYKVTLSKIPTFVLI